MPTKRKNVTSIVNPELRMSMNTEYLTPISSFKSDFKQNQIKKEIVIINKSKSQLPSYIQANQKATNKENVLRQNKSLDLHISHVNATKNIKCDASLDCNRFPQHNKSVIPNQQITPRYKDRSLSSTQKINITTAACVRENSKENYFKQKESVPQKSKLILNLETHCSSNTSKKGIETFSNVSFISKVPTKTMNDLSNKNFNGKSSVFETITYSQRKTPTFYDNSSFLSCSRNTPIDRLKKKEGIKGRYLRGQYSSGNMQISKISNEDCQLSDLKNNNTVVKIK